MINKKDWENLTEAEKLAEYKRVCKLIWISESVSKKTFELVELDVTTNKDKLKFDRKIDEILLRRAESKIFRFKNEEEYTKEFLKTFVAIWVNDENIDYEMLVELEKEGRENLDNDIDESGDLKTYKNYVTNYKNWIGKKLMLWKEDRKQKTIEDIETMASPYITYWIWHIKEFMKMFNSSESEFLKSEFFETIHSTWKEQKTVYEYIEMIFDLEKSKKDILKKQEYKENPTRFQHLIKNIEMWKFEIQRLLWLSLLYLDREKNHVHQHIEEDISFIIWKLLEIVPEWQKKDFVDLKTWVDSPLYPYVNTNYQYWKKTKTWYIYSDTPKSWYNSLKMNSMFISWEYRDYKKNKVDINLRHIEIRGKKSWFSSVEKLIRKWFSSFNEILDHKWFIFVVDNFKDWEKLLRIIENKLWTLRSSWIEEPKSMKEIWGNNFSSDSYDCMKWVIKIPYKWKLIKHFFEILDSHMEFINWWLKKSFNEFKSQVSLLDMESDENIEKLENLVEEFKNTDITNVYHDLKARFKEKSYNIEVEIQIFDMENYMKAEIDQSSRAYHGKYRMRQLAENTPIYFPKELYGELNIKSPIKRIIKENL